MLQLVQYFGGLGIYKYLIDFAGAGATVPLTGFGANLAKGAIEEVKQVEELLEINKDDITLLNCQDIHSKYLSMM